MDLQHTMRVVRPVTAAGLAGMAELDLLTLFCAASLAEGLPLARAVMAVDTLHPVHEGRVFRWRRDPTDIAPMMEYGRTNQGAPQESWQRSPFYHLLQSGEGLMRRKLDRPEPDDFSILGELRSEGMTEFVVMITRFEANGVVGEMDCIYSTWSTDAPGGFSDQDITTLEELVPSLALAVKCTSLARIAETLVETYLGRDAGQRVLSGRIARGVADRIGAVLWFSDLKGFTRITQEAKPDEIIPFLNDYAEAIITPVQEAGGDVLKLIGDGVLAIFKADDRGEACRCALDARDAMQARIGALNRDRTSRGLPVTSAYLGLHTGDVFYGNVGSQDRLDFTVVGPAVNEVSRISGLCRSVERDVLVSPAFHAAAWEGERRRLVSVGRYALRGVERPQELFTLDDASGPQARPDGVLPKSPEPVEAC